MLEILIQNGADWHAEGDQALISAARDGFTEIVSLLLRAGEPCCLSKDQALREAEYNGHPDVARILIDDGASQS
jgi:ankyrin repeat protein